MVPKRFIQSFHQKYQVVASGCWEWTRGRFENGYGKFNRRSVAYGLDHYAHRTSWIIHHGSIPQGMLVLHSCDNRCCVNPAHLFLGTPLDNSLDASKKGRLSTWKRPSKEQHGRAKLTQDQVNSIKMDERPRKVIAKEYGVSLSRISKIKLGYTWKETDVD